MRITFSTRGVYVTASAAGFSYRQRIGRGGERSRPPASSEAPRPLVYESTVVRSADLDELSDISQDDFVASLNEWTRRGFLQLLAGAMAVVAFLIAAVEHASKLAGEILVYGVILVLVARFIEKRRRRFLLMFDLDPVVAERYQNMHRAFAALAASGSLRGIGLIDRHHDWKRSGGATRALSFESATLRQAAPPYIVSNLKPWILSTQGMQLCFFPDRVLIHNENRFAALSYGALTMGVAQSDFVWDEPMPHDAIIVDSTWLFVRKDGGPDGRFNNNRQIPVVRTATLAIESATGLRIKLQTTRPEAAAAVVEDSVAYARYAQVASTPLVEGVSTEIAAALAILGLSRLPSSAELREAYRALTARLPVTTNSAELHALHHQRTAEVNRAYARLQHELTILGLASELLPTRPTPPVYDAGGKALEIAVISSALLLGGGVFAFARSREEVVGVTTSRPVETSASVATFEPSPTLERRRASVGCLLREHPSPQAKQHGLVTKGSEVSVLEVQGEWTRVEDAGGRQGWVSPQCWRSPVRKQSRALPRVQALPKEPEAAPFGSGAGELANPYEEPVVP